MSYVVKTVAESVKGKDFLCPCQCGAQMGVRLLIINACIGICGGELKVKFPSANFSDCWSNRLRIKNRIAYTSEESAFPGKKKSTPYTMEARI